jgi:hypothetical protein
MAAVRPLMDLDVLLKRSLIRSSKQVLETPQSEGEKALWQVNPLFA